MDQENNNYIDTSSVMVSISSKKSSWFKKVVWLVVIIIIAFGGYYGYKYYQTKRSADPQYQQAQVDKLIKEVTDNVSKLIILPTGEVPTVATITDADKLKVDQPFYNDAQNGDQLLVYSEARKAIIYSPKRNIIVNSGPVFVQNEQRVPPVDVGVSSSTKKK